MTDSEILQALSPMMDDAEQYQQELSAARAEQNSVYEADPYGNERKGWASTVHPSAMDAVEWIKPYLFNIFTGDFFTLTARNQDQATALENYIRFKLFRQKPGANEVDDFIHYALVNHYGAMKVTHTEEFTYETKKVPEITAEQMVQIASDDSITVAKYTEEESIDPMTGETVPIYKDVKLIHRETSFRGPIIENLPPSELYFTPGYARLEDCPLVAHVVRRSLDYVRKQEREGNYKKGSYDAVVDKVISTFDNPDSAAELSDQRARDDVTQSSPSSYTSPMVSGNEEVEIWECYCKLDIDDDGYLEEAIVVICEDVVLKDPEENIYKSPPIEIGSALRQPNNILGKSFADLMAGWQRAMTNMQRAIQDAALLSTKRGFLTESINTQHALRQWSPGDVAKVDSLGGVEQVDFGAPNQFLFKAYEQINADKDKNSGVNEAAMGMDRDANNKTARGMGMKLTVTQARQQLYADRLSRTFSKVIRRVIDILAMFPPEDDFGATSAGIDINQVNFQDDFAIRIDVGVGPQDQQIKAQLMDAHLQFLLSAGLQLGVATPEHVVKTVERKASYLKISMEGLIKPSEEVQIEDRRKQLQQQQRPGPGGNRGNGGQNGGPQGRPNLQPVGKVPA